MSCDDGHTAYCGSNAACYNDDSFLKGNLEKACREVSQLAFTPPTPDSHISRKNHCSLLRNRIGVHCAKAIVEAAESKPQLTTLCGIKTYQTEAYFKNQYLQAEDAILLASDLRKNSKLLKLE